MAESGPRYWVERAMAPLGRFLGWHPDMGFSHILDVPVASAAEVRPLRPLGIFTLVRLDNP
jgi:phosphatidylethanolamine/phosphatidyl-N-methylethanolamine N-methyltransferase